MFSYSAASKPPLLERPAMLVNSVKWQDRSCLVSSCPYKSKLISLEFTVEQTTAPPSFSVTPTILLLILTSILVMVKMQSSAMTPTHDKLATMTLAPTVRELEKRRGGGGRGGGGGGGGGDPADFAYDTTCGLIPHSLGKTTRR